MLKATKSIVLKTLQHKILRFAKYYINSVTKWLVF